MPDKKITVTDEMVGAAMDAAFTPKPVWPHSMRAAITAALDAAPATDEDEAARWQKAALKRAHERDQATARAEKAEQERDEAQKAAEFRKLLLDKQQDVLDSYASMSAREHLDAVWEAAYVPEDGIIPAGAVHIRRDGRGTIYGPTSRKVTLDADGPGEERRLLDPPAPKRPAGAEELAEVLDGLFTGDEGIYADDLADSLARCGVRVVTEEQP